MLPTALVVVSNEEYVRITDQVACTSQLQTWNQPRKRVLEPSEVSNIKFVKMELGKRERSIQSKLYDPCPPKHNHTSGDEIESASTSLPPIPRSSIEKVKHMLKGQPQPPSLKNIMDLGQNLISRLKT